MGCGASTPDALSPPPPTASAPAAPAVAVADDGVKPDSAVTAAGPTKAVTPSPPPAPAHAPAPPPLVDDAVVASSTAFSPPPAAPLNGGPGGGSGGGGGDAAVTYTGVRNLKQRPTHIMLTGHIGGEDGDGATVYALAWHQTDNQLASASTGASADSNGESADSNVRLWNSDGDPIPDKCKGGDADAVRMLCVDSSLEPDCRVISMAFSPSGMLATSYNQAEPCSVRLWERHGSDANGVEQPGGGGLIQQLKGHTSPVQSCTWSSDGALLATGSSDSTVRLWDAEGALVKELTGHTESVNWVAWSPSGQLLASASDDATVRLWGQNGDLVHELTGHTPNKRRYDGLYTILGGVTCVAWHPDGEILTSASKDMTMRFWGKNGDVVKVIEGHSCKAGFESRPGFDVDIDGNEVKHLVGHTSCVEVCAWSPNGDLLASASSDHTVRLWDRYGNVLRKLSGHTGAVMSCAWSPNGEVLASGGTDNTVRLWDLKPCPKAPALAPPALAHVNSQSRAPGEPRLSSASPPGPHPLPAPPPGAPGASRLTTGVTLTFLRDLPSIIAKVPGGSFTKSWQEGEETRKKKRYNGDEVVGQWGGGAVITTEQLVFGKSSRNATGPGWADWCIADVTKQHACCFIEWCEREGLTHSAAGDPYFAPVTHFVSHAWHASFPDLVATLELYAAGDDGMGSGVPASTAAWFLDVFLINQHCPPWREDPPRPPDQVLKPPIEACGRCVLVLQPWEKPKAFTRAWCLFEIMSTLNVPGATLDVALSRDERERFVDTLVTQYSSILANISAIDARKATATVLEDRDAIFRIIESGDASGGFDSLNNAVMEAIRGWLVGAAAAEIPRLEGAHGADSKEVAGLVNALGQLFVGQGRYKEALEAFTRVLQIADTIYARDGGYEVVGEEDPDVADALCNQAGVYHLQGMLDKAREAYERAHVVMEKSLGKRDTNYLTTLSYLADVYSAQGRYDEAMEMYHRVRVNWKAREINRSGTDLGVINVMWGGAG